MSFAGGLPEVFTEAVVMSGLVLEPELLLDSPSIKQLVDYSLALPTDIGLPIIIQYTEDFSYWLDRNLIEQQLSPKKIISLTATLDYSQDSTLVAKTLLPWSQKFAVGTGVHNVFSLIVPLKFHSTQDVHHREVKVTVESQHSGKVLLVNSHNYPYTVVTGAFPTALHPHQIDYRKIRITNNEIFQRRTQALPSDFGISVESSWSADFEFPANFRALYKDDFFPFTPSYKSWDYRLEWDPEASTTKNITFTLRYVDLKKEKSEAVVQEEDYEQLGQETQETADFGDFSERTDGESFDIEIDSSDIQEAGDLEQESFVQQRERGRQSRERITKLQEEVMPISGGYVQSVSVGVNFQGPNSRSYEAVLTWAVGSGVHKTSTRTQLTFVKNAAEGFFDEAHTTCFNILVLKPKFTPLTTVEKVLATDLKTTVGVQVNDGISCRGPPVLEGQGALDVSEEAMIRLREELAEHCDSETVHPLPLEIITSPLYDHAHFKAQWTEDYPLILKNLTNSLNDIVDGILFPLVSYDHTATNPEYTREIDATKDLDTNRWTIRDKRPNLVAVTSDLNVPVLFQEFLSPAKITRTFNYNFIEGRTSSTCFIKTTKVVTFDGVAFPYQADSCWVTIAISYGQYDGTQYRLNSMAKARFTDQWEVQAIWPWGGLVIDITKSHILINGEDYEGENQFVKFTKNENASMFFFKSLGFVIIISDKIQFRMPKILNGNLHGLCGRMDGEKRHDLVGPTGCIFTNPSLFALSWTTQGEGCSLFSLRSKKRGVTQYQEACPREDYTPTAVSHPSVVYDCTEWEYKELTTGDVRCIANEPTPVCKPGCKKTSDTRKPIEYDCTITGSDQPEAYCQSSGQGRNLTKECFPHTRVTTYPASCLPQ